MNHYHLNLGTLSIALGMELDMENLAAQPPISTVARDSNGIVDWNLPAGVYLAKDIVRELDTLLEAVLVQLGSAADAEALLYNLQANLAISGRESDLPLGQLALETKPGIELTKQATRIGDGITRWAREFNAEKWASQIHGSSILAQLHSRSRCDNHLWTDQVANLLMGPAGSPAVMQLFNEYLHQLILLRDALLPFENWEEVPIEIHADSGEGRGLRFLERGRAEFLPSLMGKRLSHKAIVRFAQSVLSPALSTVGYGFQYRLGSILPASLSTGPLNDTRYLLRWYPVQIVTTGNEETMTSVSFDYEYSDYYAAPRSQLVDDGRNAELQLQDQELKSIERAQIVPSYDGERAILHYKLRNAATVYTVDLGQVFRGHRFMYRTSADPGSDSGQSMKTPTDISNHFADDILSLHGLVTNTSGTHLISVGRNPLILWSLLGKLYPENIILLESVDEQELQAASRSGKGFGAKFLIY